MYNNQFYQQQLEQQITREIVNSAITNQRMVEQASLHSHIQQPDH